MISNSKKGHILEVDVEYPKELHSKHGDLQFLCDRKKLNKIEKIFCTLDNTKNCFSPFYIKRSIKSWIKIDKSTYSYGIYRR